MSTTSTGLYNACHSVQSNECLFLLERETLPNELRAVSDSMRIPWTSHPQGHSSVISRSKRQWKLKKSWNYIFPVPPLCVGPSELQEGLAILDEVLVLADEIAAH